jgi:hypothetical protein
METTVENLVGGTINNVPQQNEAVNEKKLIKASDIAHLLRSGYVKYPTDKHYNAERKNSIMDLYNLTQDECKYLFNLPLFKNFRVVIPKERPKVELSFQLEEDVTEEQLKNYGKMSKSAKARMAKKAEETNALNVSAEQPA